MPRKKRELGYQRTRTELYILLDGVRIAKRGKPGIHHARRWISLVPGLEVVDDPKTGDIMVRDNGSLVH